MTGCDINNALASELLLLQDDSSLVSLSDVLDTDACADLDIDHLTDRLPDTDDQESLVEQLTRLIIQKDKEIEELSNRVIVIERQTSQQLADLTMKWSQRSSTVTNKIKLTQAQLQAALNDNQILAFENHDLKAQMNKLVNSMSDSERSNNRLRNELRASQDAMQGMKASFAQQTICLEDQQERLQLLTDPLPVTQTQKRCCCSKIRTVTKGLPEATILNLIERYANIQLCDSAVQTDPEPMPTAELPVSLDDTHNSLLDMCEMDKHVLPWIDVRPKYRSAVTEAISIVSQSPVRVAKWSQTDELCVNDAWRHSAPEVAELKDDEGTSTTASSSSVESPTEKHRSRRQARCQFKSDGDKAFGTHSAPAVACQVYIVGHKKVVIPPIGPDEQYHSFSPSQKSLVNELESELLDNDQSRKSHTGIKQKLVRKSVRSARRFVETCCEHKPPKLSKKGLG